MVNDRDLTLEFAGTSFYFIIASRSLWEATQDSVKKLSIPLFPEVRRPDREADYSHLGIYRNNLHISCITA
jgi:hypothetical protein